jgi:hypothetical protein
MKKPKIVFVVGYMVQVDADCPTCKKGHALMTRDDWDNFEELDEDEIRYKTYLCDCVECDAADAAAEAFYGAESERMAERLRDWEAERLHGPF